ncbi:hypothetical protein FTUN_7417 [Frigoriglobus tundricola]|uniref:Uncharacterized protein n=1 Tax=Frigoriglobus tundricola TaxID=2774151 RepID=A0A6M5Z1Y6_9BACT|nr:hypothetical protein FTUN_7417 [Frigoriglobus tundricola]
MIDNRLTRDVAPSVPDFGGTETSGRTNRNQNPLPGSGLCSSALRWCPRRLPPGNYLIPHTQCGARPAR